MNDYAPDNLPLTPTQRAVDRLDAVTKAIYQARWVDAYGPNGQMATDRVLAAAALAAAAGGGGNAERFRAGLRLISPDDITPMGKRMLEKILDEELR